MNVRATNVENPLAEPVPPCGLFKNSQERTKKRASEKFSLARYVSGQLEEPVPSRGSRRDLGYGLVAVACEPLWLRSDEFVRGSL